MKETKIDPKNPPKVGGKDIAEIIISALSNGQYAKVNLWQDQEEEEEKK